jgi:hypothetical protein
MSYKGFYRPSHPEKYIGNPNNIIYRSLWERKFMYWCDHNQNILKFASEEIRIPYVSPLDNRIHFYYPDFYIKYKDSKGNMKESLIEVKPKRQVEGPNPKKKVTQKQMYEIKEFAKNQAKWKAAKEFCEDRKWEFQILTEDHLFNKQ